MRRPASPGRADAGAAGSGGYTYDAELLLLSKMYELLRAEILDSISRQQKLMAGEITVAGLISTLGLMITKAMPLLVCVPLIVLSFYAVWAVEQTRILRIARFLLLLECGMNLSLRKPVVLWETWRRLSREDISKLHHIVYRVADIAWFLALFLMGLLSSIFSLPILPELLPYPYYSYMAIFCLLLPLIILVALFALFIAARLKWRKINLSDMPNEYLSLRGRLAKLWLKIPRKDATP